MKKRILQVGAHEELMMNYYRHFDSDICFDYIIQKGMADFKYKLDSSFDGKLWYVYSIKKNPIKWMVDLINILRCEKYNIVHLHLGFLNVWGLIACLFAPSAKIRICHSHSFYKSSTNFRNFLRIISKFFINLLSTHRIACSIDAGNQMFSKNFLILNNAIDYDRLSFDTFKRKSIRESLDLEQAYVIGHVGNFSYEKNHIFLVQIFEILAKKYSNFRLILIGSDFGTMEAIRVLCKEKSLNDKILFLGQRNDVADILQCMDCFVFPSIFEGLPLALLEAQASGLKCFYSNSISADVIISNTATSIDLALGYNFWANILDQHYNTSSVRNDNRNIIIDKFDVKYNKEILENFYLDLI